MTLKAAR
jgi:hypothetical protein